MTLLLVVAIALGVWFLNNVVGNLAAPEAAAGLKALARHFLRAGVRLSPARRRKEYEEAWAAELLHLFEQDRVLSGVMWSFGRLFGSVVDLGRRSPPVVDPFGSVSRALVWLGGANNQLLAKLPTERPRFVGIGLTVLVNAVLACVMMLVAVSSVLNVHVVAAVALALIWAGFCLNLDRWLCGQSLPQRWTSRMLNLAPRVVLALLISVLLAEPLVLEIFNAPIQQHIASHGGTPPSGVLERIQALHEIDRTNGFIRTAHLLVVGQLALLQLMPLLARVTSKRYNLVLAMWESHEEEVRTYQERHGSPWDL